jgi:coenzyme PQQ biosynthesis protein PqqD
MNVPGGRPRLAKKARLRRDKVEGKHLLLYPERGLALNHTAARIVELCTGAATVEQIVAQLAGEFPERSAADIGGEVAAFLGELAERALIEWV